MLWIKAFHIIFMVCWFAGIFYLPRLFVNSALTTDSNTQQHLALMQTKLFRFITPFAVLTIIFGLWLTGFNAEYYSKAAWFHAKIVLVSLLVIYHISCGYFVRQFNAKTNRRSQRFFRWYNEAPVFILFTVVILVVVKPI